MLSKSSRRFPLNSHSLDRLMDQLEPRRLFAAGTPAGQLIDGEQLLAKSTPYSADRFWANLDAVPTASAPRQLGINATAFEPFTLDASRLRQKLSNAPLEDLSIGIGQAANSLEISIPTPEGTLARFNVVESSIMEPGLAAQFPTFKTYAGVGVDDPSARIRLDFTDLGFHAQVLASGTTFYVDPYYHLDTSVYGSYYRRDAIANPANLAAGCLVDDHLEQEDTNSVETTSGTQLRTYRLAVGATGEYTAFFGGTVAAGQSAIVTAVNRVSGVYETELSIRLTLVANNSSIVYTNAATDPYTNTSPSALLTQNQSTCDSVIGNANYDIGHVFSTGGGGLAGLGVVGITGNKARAETGLPSPVGDAFYIDYVAHEMGHQFGGNHNFNTSSDPNRNASTAYEPGSGSTIMAYAGITGSNSDLQTNSDPYFHWISQQEIVNRCDNTIPAVGVRTATGNTVPTVNGGLDYVIPAQTPFALTAVGNDGDGDPLTYSWEEADLGAATLLTTADNGSSPLFRVYNPTSSPTRSFPRLNSVLNGTNATTAPFGGLAERLPTTNRFLNFRVTVRDNRAAGGGINTDDVRLTVINTGAAFAITSFNSASTLPGGSTQTLTWNVAGTTAPSMNAANLRLLMSTDGGTTFPTVVLASTPNDGSESFTVPNVSSGAVRFRLESATNVFYDINNANLTVTATVSSATPGTPQLTAASDTGASNSDLITKLNNSSAGNALVFSVPGTVSGATVVILADGVEIGSAVASGTTTLVTTNGTSTLLDGSRAMTAKQTEPGKSQSPASAAQNVFVDATAPTGAAVAFNRLIGPHQVLATFSENVQPSLTGSDLSLTNTPFGSSNGTPSVAYDGGTNTATFTFPGASGGILADGNYASSIGAASVSDVAGNNLAAAVSGSFFVLAGDADGDKDVDLDDFTTLASNFGASPRNFAQGDFSYSGGVDLDDFTLQAANFGVVLPPASLPRAAGNTPFSEVKVADRLVDVIQASTPADVL